MQIDFTRVLIDFRGQSILDGEGFGIQLRTVACTALTAVLQVDQKASIDDKLRRDDLARRVWQGETEVTVEEAALLKERINAVYPSAALVSAAVRILEGKMDVRDIENGANVPTKASTLHDVPDPEA